MLECQSCGGRYEPIGADGVRYFHACPPLSQVELQAAIDAGKVRLAKDETAEDAVQRRTYHRANARDENVVAPTTHGGAVTIKAEGAGVLELVDVVAAATTVVVDV